MNKLKAPLLIAIIAMSCCAPAAQAACEQWDVSGKWQVRQSNIEDPLYFEIQQEGSKLSGKAFFADGQELSMGGTLLILRDGKVTGTLRGNKLDMIVNWDASEYDKVVKQRKGVYKGKIGTQGQLAGTTFDAKNLNSSASFSRKKAFKCMDVAIEEPPGPPPIELGKVPIPEVVLENPLDICGYARSARKRGSPAAPGLERQCREAGGVP